MSEENTLRFLDHYKEVRSEWLLTGQGEMLRGEAVEALSASTDGVVVSSELLFLREANELLKDKIDLLEQNRVLLLREIARLGGDVEKVVVDE